MTDLDLSVRDYKNSILLIAFITRIKDDIVVLPTVRGAVFRPVINGYEISLEANGRSYKVELNVRKRIFFKDKLTVRILDRYGLIKEFKAVDVDEGIEKLRSILT